MTYLQSNRYFPEKSSFRLDGKTFNSISQKMLYQSTFIRFSSTSILQQMAQVGNSRPPETPGIYFDRQRKRNIFKLQNT